jgi:heterodisulfide reductase subunit B2
MGEGQMGNSRLQEMTYFPGCSLATSARENNQSLNKFCRQFDIHLIELEDWNCCGSSSAHSIDSGVAMDLPARNLFLAPNDRPLLAPCPSCFLRLRHAHLHLKENEDTRGSYEKMFGRPFNPDLQIMNFFELLETMNKKGVFKENVRNLNGLTFASYYGCMLARPPALRHEKNFFGLMENTLSSLGGTPVSWNHSSRCCGTFLSVSRPYIATRSVNEIVANAIDSGAECIITACAMCHLNLEIRCGLKQKIPVFHFSEILSLSVGINDHKGWFKRHLVDPGPLLKSKNLISS